MSWANSYKNTFGWGDTEGQPDTIEMSLTNYWALHTDIYEANLRRSGVEIPRSDDQIDRLMKLGDQIVTENEKNRGALTAVDFNCSSSSFRVEVQREPEDSIFMHQGRLDATYGPHLWRSGIWPSARDSVAKERLLEIAAKL